MGSLISGVRLLEGRSGAEKLMIITDGYRFMIPFLLEKGFRVIVPDMLGYGQTVRLLLCLDFLMFFFLQTEQLTKYQDAPRVPPADISVYSVKNHAADMVELLKILNVPKVILFGHDWYYFLYLILASSSTNMSAQL